MLLLLSVKARLEFGISTLLSIVYILPLPLCESQPVFGGPSV